MIKIIKVKQKQKKTLRNHNICHRRCIIEGKSYHKNKRAKYPMDHTQLDKQVQPNTVIKPQIDTESVNTVDSPIGENERGYPGLNLSHQMFCSARILCVIVLSIFLTPLMAFISSSKAPIYSLEVTNPKVFDDSVTSRVYRVGIWDALELNTTSNTYVEIKSSMPVEKWLLSHLRSLPSKDLGTLQKTDNYKSLDLNFISVVICAVVLRSMLLFSFILGLVISLRKIFVMLWNPRERGFNNNNDVWLYTALLIPNICYYVSLLSMFFYCKSCFKEYNVKATLGSWYQVLVWSVLVLNAVTLVFIRIGYKAATTY